MDPGTLENLIKGYIALRDKKAALKKQQETALKEYTDAMVQIEDFLKAHLQKQRVNSVSCDAGTAFIKRKRSATLADKGVFREFVISSQNFDLCDMSAKVEAVEDWVKEHEGQLPPGVNYSSYEGVNIQRK
jgi:hypothetical protein